MKVICISGKAGAGKDVTAEHLKRGLALKGVHRNRILITHFADPLKMICRNWFGWDGQKDEVARSLLQYVGTDVVRAADPNFWTDFTMKLISIMKNEWDYVIIPDCRFENEVDLKRYGFPTFHINVERRCCGQLTKSQQLHSSENELCGVKPDVVIHNDDTISALVIECVKLADRIHKS